MLVCILVCKDTRTADKACFFKSLPINTLDFVLFGMVVTQTIELAADSVTGVYAQLLKQLLAINTAAMATCSHFIGFMNTHAL